MSENHPVWDVYDQLRTVRLNQKYYGMRLKKLELINFWSEIVVAFTSSSSVIAGFAFWSSENWRPLWTALLFISALVAITKPLLNLTKKIRLYEELLSGYCLLYHDMKELRIDINQSQAYTKVHQQKFKKIIDKQRLIADRSPERTENKKIKDLCQKSVLEELPTRSFYIPENSYV